jgi:hypothetical protein
MSGGGPFVTKQHDKANNTRCIQELTDQRDAVAANINSIVARREGAATAKVG